MTEHDDHTGDDADLLAAEYALGVLEADQRREAEARLQRDPAFAAEVVAWSERLAPMAEATPAVSPPEALWVRIAARLPAEKGANDNTPGLQRDPAFAAEVAAWSERLAPMAEATPAVSPPAALWGRIAARLPAEKGANDNTPGLRFWRSLAIGASGLAAASVAAVVVLLARPAVPKPEVATLVTAKGVAAVVVAFDPRTGALLVSPAPGLQAAGHTPHLWLREPGGSVTLVGAIDASKPATHSLPPELARQAAKAAGLALSLEPAGHKPIDRPGGEVVASGDFTEL